MVVITAWADRLLSCRTGSKRKLQVYRRQNALVVDGQRPQWWSTLFTFHWHVGLPCGCISTQEQVLQIIRCHSGTIWLQIYHTAEVMGIKICFVTNAKNTELEMWANAQRDGHPAEYRWRPLFNAAVWLTTTTRVPCSNAAKTRNPLKLPGVPQTNERISAASGPKFTILWRHVWEILLLNKFFSDCRYMP